ncbi:hypothetical protein FA10DRAFT_266417 [Acaromyces ingoldii]|uniref:PQ-loop-domain-containing protein n=1 Tax=Acaromyces ingoldii TaxID=215250 RepID=A0A316YKX8_9BASI|nr:hypothetical protein FA10DRAFT_266417 [Acaromyces ingoldii]PWN89869.1 hypothetical protein FA10DRAFT_266417 [Acaromyces ingoldii]
MDLNLGLGLCLFSVGVKPLIRQAEHESGFGLIQRKLVPSVSQLHENYVLKSGEGLSITFIIIWLAGDALNMIGAYRAELLSTMIILAGYYCLCDIALIWQYYYYRKYHDYYHPSAVAGGAQPAAETPAEAATESTPLVNGNTAKPPPAASAAAVRREPTFTEEVVKCIAGLVVVSIAGVFSWYATTQIHGHPAGDPPALTTQEWKWDAQVSGWASAFLYLASRVPQIFKNRQTKCEGLSLALFVFAVAGNLTYVASIVLKSTERDWLVENLSWMVGSLGTVFLDFVVLAQFVAYSKERRERTERTAAATAAGQSGVSV